MLNGIFSNPTKIFFGSDALSHLGAACAQYGSHVLIVAGNKSYDINGLSTTIRRSLDAHNISYTELMGVRPDPTSDLVYEGIHACRAAKSNLVLAVGGGSVIDTAKAIGIGAHYSGDFFDFFARTLQPRSSVPVGAVVTIAGSGSDSSDGAVITKGSRKYSCGSPVMYPAFAILDPTLTLSVPPFLTACGVVDAISHVFERYFTQVPHVVTSTALCEALLRVLVTQGKQVLAEPSSYDIRAELMWASKLAHDNAIAFGRKGDWATHAIAHEVAVRCHSTHGATLAVLFPAWMQHVLPTHPALLASLGREVFGVGPRRSEIDAAHATIDAYRVFLNGIGMPSRLRDIGVTTHSSLRGIAEACSLTTLSGTLGHFKRLTIPDTLAILQNCF